MRRGRGVRRRADPGLPGHRGGADLGDRPAASGSCWTPSPRRPTRCRPRVRAEPEAGRRSARRCARSTGREPGGAVPWPARRLKWDEAFAVQLTLVQRKLPGGRTGRRCPGRGATDGLLAAFDAAAAVRADRRPARRSATEIAADLAAAAPDAPAAAGRGRLGQDACARCGRCCRWSTPAGRRRCSPRPRCSPPSTTAACATCSARWPGPASWTRADDATRVALVTGSLGAAARRQALARGRPRRGRHRASAPTPCSTRGSTSPTWAWSWSTSSTGSASSSATRCGPRPTSRRTCW